MSLFNTCIITTASADQARIYGELIRKRIHHGLYPSEIEFKIYSDPPGGKVGSGGATLLALKRYMEDAGWTDNGQFDTRRILIIHAGGLNPRVPCYGPEGALFIPVPIDSSSIIPPVVLDLHLSLFLKYPWKKGEVVITPADIIADFDTSDITDHRGDICGFASAGSFEKGSAHGVFRFDSFRRNVVDYFQKSDPDYLRLHATLEGTRKCALDMGIVSLSPSIIDALFEALEIKTGEGTMLQVLQRGGISFDLYLELMISVLADIDFTRFRSLVQPFTSLKENVLYTFFELFSKFNLSAVLTRNSTFLHLSSSFDFMQSCLELQKKEIRLFYSNDYEELRVFNTPEQLRFNCIDLNLPVGRHKPVLAENVENSTIENVLGANLLTGITGWISDIIIPENICIDQRNTAKGPVKIIYGLEDAHRPGQDLKSMVFCGTPMESWLTSRDLKPSDLWEDDVVTGISSARLFFVNSPDGFLEGYWSVPGGTQWTETFRAAKRFSLNQINNNETAVDRERKRQIIRMKQLRGQILSNTGWNNVAVNDFSAAFSEGAPLDELKKIYDSTDEFLLKSYRKRLYEQVARTKQGSLTAFEFPQQNREDLLFENGMGIGPEKMVLVQSPVRIDLAGGWTDTPPFTLRNGGAVVNLAVDLDGRPPVQVSCKASSEFCIRLISIDLGAIETLENFEEIASFHSSPLFALPRAALYLMGFNRNQSGVETLSDLLRKQGYGIQITMISGIPSGSGLGASSILASSILASLYSFYGKAIQSNGILNRVMTLEKMLSPGGGGWQDTIGGIIGGLKYIESKPSLTPEPIVYQLDPTLFTDESMLDRFTLFFTGIRRPERNIAEEVAGRMDNNTPNYLFTLKTPETISSIYQRCDWVEGF